MYFEISFSNKLFQLMNVHNYMLNLVLLNPVLVGFSKLSVNIHFTLTYFN